MSDGNGISARDYLPVESDNAEQMPGIRVWNMGNPEELLKKMYHKARPFERGCKNLRLKLWRCTVFFGLPTLFQKSGSET